MAAAATPRSEPDAADASTNLSLQFGTAEALEHVSKLTDVGAMTRLLHECIAYQRALDLELETLLSQRSDLDRQLSNLQKSADVLEIVKVDSSYMLSNVTATSSLADQVSSKVRHLDLAQSRVQDTLLRIDAIVDKSNCLEGVHKSLLAEDFESAASYIQTFLQIDSKFKDSSAADQREQLLSYKKQLEGIAKKRLLAAVDQRDHPTIIRFIKLYTPLGLEEEGLQVNFVVCLTNLFKDIVLAIEENNEILRNLCGEDGIVYAICELQEECDSREGPDPREIEIYLEEILSLTQLGEDYTEYMVSKIRSLTSVDPELCPRATKAFRSGNFSKVSQDITGYYVILEGFFMVENSCCRRAISTSNINSVIAVLSSAVSLLGGEYSEALQQKMREPNLGAKLFLGGVGVQKTGTEIATALNNMDVSSEYALKLRHEIEEQCAEVCTDCHLLTE
ncbi:UNVERIFIED_CONTAM: Conserved oligomeric Golgi complex subunit [Sesamum radiatum]|uniref:Conserved oligomeric Golgi complex subunit 4 n=1 Tax=Sesamum radiatum TaxID=300843 RepID=A0AAW2KBS2_SESRA